MAPLQPSPIALDFEAKLDTRVSFCGNDRAKFTAEVAGASGAYEIGAEIARGGMGVVHEARHKEMGRIVAMKIMLGASFANPEDIARFRAETEAVERLDHPNIVPIYEVGEIFGQPFFTMKRIEGGCLGRFLRTRPLSLRASAHLVAKIARAVQHAHERGVLHRDIKPGNILLDPAAPGEEIGEPYLTDFGLAKFAGSEHSLTCPGDLVGTPDFIAPEQARGSRDLTTACDVWALGVLLYQMISGKLPFNAPTALATLERVKHEEPAPLDCDRDLATIVARCLEKNPAHRMAGAGFLADELDRWLEGEPIRSRHVTPAERVWKWMQRHPWRVAAAVLITLSILAGGITSFVMWQDAQDANFSLNAANDTLKTTNVALERSLRLSTATRLASESRLQIRDNAQLGVLLAIESAETTRRADGTLLPESVSALFNAVQHVGGVDASGGRGKPTAATRSRGPREGNVYPSPDGRWLLTVDAKPDFVAAALFDSTLPISSDATRRWMLSPKKRASLMLFDACWLPDSRHVLTMGLENGEVALWDLDPATDGDPPKRVLGNADLTSGIHFDGAIVHNSAGIPIALVHSEDLDKKRFLRWQPITLDGAAERLGPAVNINIPEERSELRRNVYTSRDGRWVIGCDLFLSSRPALLRVDGEVAPIAQLLQKPASPIYSAAVSDNGNWLVLGEVDGSIELYDLSRENIDAIRASARIIHRRTSTAHALAFSPDGKWLAAVGDDAFAQIFRLDGSAQLVREFRIIARTSASCAFSADSEWLAIGGEDAVVRAWPVGAPETKRPIEFRGLAAPIATVHFVDNGQTLFARAINGECRRWIFNGNNAGAIPLTSSAGPNSIHDIAVSPDGRWLATATAALGYNDPAAAAIPVRFFDVNAGLKEFKVPGHRVPSGVAFSSDGRWFASVGRDAVIKVWPLPALSAALESGDEMPTPLSFEAPGTRDNYERRVAFHPSGRLYATCGDGILFEWNLNAPDPAASMRSHLVHSIRYILSDVAVSPDGRWLAIGRHGNDTTPREGWTQTGNLVLVYDCSDPEHLKPRYELRANFTHLGAVAFSADSRWLAGGAVNGPGNIWDLAAADVPASVRATPFTAPFITGVAFSPAPKKPREPSWLCIGANDGRLYLWDWQHGAAALCRIETNDAVHAAVFLPDGRLATGSGDGRVRVWETDPDKLIQLARTTAGRTLTVEERELFARRSRQ